MHGTAGAHSANALAVPRPGLRTAGGIHIGFAPNDDNDGGRVGGAGVEASMEGSLNICHYLGQGGGVVWRVMVWCVWR